MHLPSYLIFCLFAVFLAVIRIFITGDFDLSVWLTWNLILAFFPYIFALFSLGQKGFLRKIGLFLWFLFLPNSFYILTDFVHLPEHPEMVYFDTVYITSMAFAWLVAGYASMEMVHTYWNIHIHKKLAWIYMIAIVFIGNFGVYVGRFLRFNSWDIIQNPRNIVHELWILLITNGSVLAITDAGREQESQKFIFWVMWLWQFIFLYSSFILLVYVYLYHTKKKI